MSANRNPKFAGYVRRRYGHGRSARTPLPSSMPSPKAGASAANISGLVRTVRRPWTECVFAHQLPLPHIKSCTKTAPFLLFPCRRLHERRRGRWLAVSKVCKIAIGTVLLLRIKTLKFPSQRSIAALVSRGSHCALSMFPVSRLDPQGFTATKGVQAQRLLKISSSGFHRIRLTGRKRENLTLRI